MGRYIVIGLSVYLFELGVIYTAQHAGANPLVAVSLSFWLGLLVSFALQKFVTFRDHRMHHQIVLTQFATVTALVIGNFCFTLLVTELLRPFVPAAVSRTIALGITTLWNFYLYKTRIFTGGDKPEVNVPLDESPEQSLFTFRMTRPSPVRLYAFGSVAVLLATSWYWAMLGSHTHMGNADQLVNTYLFDDAQTFHGAQWPGQHTFLLKWPLFMAVRLFGATAQTFTIFTVGTVLLTVGLLALLMHRIERRPLVFGTLCLALASVLLLVPAQPYAGGILPVNMAMLTTRNIEYLVFIASVACFAYAPRIRHWKFAAGLGLLVVLVASDKLFLTIGVGAAAMAMLTYALARKWALVELSARWLVGSLAAAVAAIGLLSLITASGLTNAVGGSVAGPYGLVHGTKDLILGSIYMVLGLLTNLGANPAHDTRLLSTIPAQTYKTLFSLEGLALLTNIAIAVGAIVAVARIIWASITRRRTRKGKLAQDSYFKISLLLVWATTTACAVFIVSQHYYPVDARYLTIALFTAFIALATVARARQWPQRVIIAVSVVLCVSIASGLVGANRTHAAENEAMSTIGKRNALIAKALHQHHVDVLVGDYWRVVPTKLISHNHQQVLPLSNCTQPSGILNSSAWQLDLNKHRFAYLLTLDRSLTGYPPCSIDQVIQSYGRPNASTLIAGTLKQPAELLLFYDRGAHNSAPRLRALTSVPSTILPIGMNDLPYTACTRSTTTLNVIAHQDDDLLFMSPDLQHDIQANRCVRTIYVTSGDAGADKYYWISREQGSEAAYSNMLGIKDIWVERIVKLPTGQFVTVANPRGNARVSLIFMHLPDGNIQGQGFKASQYESLARLEAGGIDSIHTVDHQSTYSHQDLVSTLTAFMYLYQPAEVHTQASLVNTKHPDHSDHMNVGTITKAAYQKYLSQQYDGQPLIPLKFYIGYPIQNMPANVTGKDLDDKEQAFFAYAKYDPSVCSNEQQCSFNSNYGWYLKREYQNDY
jgi:putative flippase GtrA/LmbE family N-acetylglucosaminyl deacetylase